MYDGMITALNVAFVVLAMWVFVSYMMGPHNLRQAFLHGERPTPAVEWRGFICMGVGAADFGVLALGGRMKGLSPDLQLPLALFLFFLAAVFPIVGLVRRSHWRRSSGRQDG